MTPDIFHFSYDGDLPWTKPVSMVLCLQPKARLKEYSWAMWWAYVAIERQWREWRARVRCLQPFMGIRWWYTIYILGYMGVREWLAEVLKSIYSTGSQVWRKELKPAEHVRRNGKINIRQTGGGWIDGGMKNEQGRKTTVSDREKALIIRCAVNESSVVTHGMLPDSCFTAVQS